MGLYFSQLDWSHPDYHVGDNSKYNEFYQGQVRELLTNYGEVDIMWFDHTAGSWDDYTIPELFDMMYELPDYDCAGVTFVIYKDDVSGCTPLKRGVPRFSRPRKG